MAKTILEEKRMVRNKNRRLINKMAGENDLNSEMLNFMQKSQEANLLAWGAIAESLGDLNSRLSKADEEDEDEKKKKEEEEMKKEYDSERTALVKDIAGEVMGMLKGMMGLDVDAVKTKKVGGEDKWPMGPRLAEEDKETPVKLDTDIKTQQQPIQAMQKTAKAAPIQKHDATAILNDHMAASTHGEPVVPEEDEEVPAEEDMKDENESAEYPMEEDEAKEAPTMKMLSKQINDLQKALIAQKTTNDKEVDFRVKKVLDTFGFKKEKLSGVHKSTLGVDETPIVKAASKGDEDPIEALSKLSYQEINRLRFAQDASVGEIPKV